MSLFKLALATVLTTYHLADKATLRKMDITPKQRNQLLQQSYHLTWKPDNNKFLAQFAWSEKRINNRSTFQTAYEHTPRLEKFPMHTIVGIAAHEANHSLRRDWHSIQTNKTIKQAARAVTIGTIGYTMLQENAIDLQTVGTHIGIGVAAGLGSYYGIRHHLKYQDEVKAYRHDGLMGAMFDPHVKTLDEIRQEKDALLQKQNFGGKLYERFVSAYPTPTSREILRLQGHENALTHGLAHDTRHARHMYDLANKNLMNHRFDITGN